MTNTRDKLNEACYFLRLMGDNQNERDSFRYGLSAFLAAARSVTSFMQKEYSGVPGFKEWYDEQREWMKKDERMNVLNRKRVVTTHREPLAPRAHINVTVSDTIVVSDSAVVVKYDTQGNEIDRIGTKEPLKHIPESRPSAVEYRWYFDEIPEEDLLTACTEHVGKLDQLVSECETRFGK